MRLIHIEEGGHQLSMTEVNRDVAKYAILSHTWGEEEITFDDMWNGRRTDSGGYRKIQECCATAAINNYQYLWADTCCIDKTSSAELSEAINSMYRWYEEADVCYAYLADVPSVNFTESRWFTRGWTLQELIAPREVIFFDKEWNVLGTRDSLQIEISERTNIPLGILDGSQSLETMSIAQRMSWASERQSTRIEDNAYCLMGIFGINMPLLYGEGDKAFIRLQEEIMNVSDDHTIFAWKDGGDEYDGGLLASSPAAFRESSDIIVRPGASISTKTPWRLDNKGLHLELYTMAVGTNGLVLAVLPCTEVGMEDDWVGIYLRDKTLTMDHFERVGKDELVPVDLRLFRPAQYPLRMLCVRRQRLASAKRKPLNRRHKQEPPLNDPQTTELGLYSPPDGSQIEQPPISCQTDRGRPALSCAVMEGDVQQAWSLLSQPRVRADQPDDHGRTPLSYAAERGHTDLVWLLLARSDVNPFSADTHGITPVLYAARNGHNKVVEVLLARKNSQNDIYDDRRRTLLSYASEGGREATVHMLISRSDFDPDLEDTDGRTPLSWASQCGHSAIVALLAEHGADINATDIHGKTPIWHAVANGQTDIMHKLIDLGAHINRDHPFSLPVNKDTREKIICTLAPHSVLFHANDESGSSVLIWAAENQYQTLLDMLLTSIADIDQPDKLGRTILSWSLEHEATDVFSKIVTYGVNLNAACMCRPGQTDPDSALRKTPLSWAAESKRYGIFRMLVTHGADVNPPGTFLPGITTPLHWAVQTMHKDLFEFLLDHGADMYARDIYGCAMPIKVALEEELQDFVRILLDHGADPNFCDEDGDTPLYAAAHRKGKDTMQLLLERGASPYIRDRGSDPLVYYAAKQELHDIMSLLISHGADINQCNQNGESPLAAAIDNNDKKMAKLLLTHGANPNTTDFGGTTPLIDAIRNSRHACVALLLEHGADANARDGYGTPAVVEAMFDEKTVRLLIAHGADPHAQDEDGRSASKYA
ncbi:ankyrin repeat-containing domain protein [Aspergillus floccosus]